MPDRTILCIGNLAAGKTEISSRLGSVLRQRLVAIDECRRELGDGTAAGEARAWSSFLSQIQMGEPMVAECSGGGPFTHLVRHALGAGFDPDLVNPTSDRFPLLSPKEFSGPDIRGAFRVLAALTLVAAVTLGLGAGSMGYLASGSIGVGVVSALMIGALALGMLRMIHASTGADLAQADPLGGVGKWHPPLAHVVVMGVFAIFLCPYIAVLGLSSLPETSRLWKADVTAAVEREIHSHNLEFARARAANAAQLALVPTLAESRRAERKAELQDQREEIEKIEANYATEIAPTLRAEATTRGALADRMLAALQLHAVLLKVCVLLLTLSVLSPLVWRFFTVKQMRRHELRRVVESRTLIVREYRKMRLQFEADFQRFGVTKEEALLELEITHEDPPFNTRPFAFGWARGRVTRLESP